MLIAVLRLNSDSGNSTFMGGTSLMVYIPSLGGGGAERAMLELIAWMQRRGHDCTLVCNRAHGQYSEIADKIKIVDLDVKRTVHAFPRLRQAIQRARPDIVFSTITHANLLSIAAARATRTPPRIVVQEASSPEAIKQLGRRAHAVIALTRYAYHLVDQVVAVSRHTAEQLYEQGIDEREVVVIENSVDHDALARAASEPWPSKVRPFEGRNIVCLGRLSPEKGFDVLIRAMEDLPPDVRLTILGEGAEREKLEQQVQSLKLTERVFLPGFCINPFVVLAKADVFALPSWFEGMPVSLIQAMSLGVPSVGTTAPGGTREVLEDGSAGWLVPPGEPGALARAIGEALANPSARGPSAGWRERFSLDRTMRLYERVFFPQLPARTS